jgi:hypothetical protein
MFHLSGLNQNSLVHKSSKFGEILSSECKLDVCVESITKLLLSTGIRDDVFFSIAGQVKEFPLISFDSLIALSEVAELGFHPVHDSLRNISGTKGSLELRPSNGCSSRQCMFVGVPPLSSGTL